MSASKLSFTVGDGVDRKIYGRLSELLFSRFSDAILEACDELHLEEFVCEGAYRDELKTLASKLSSLIFRNHYNHVKGRQVFPLSLSAAENFDDRFFTGDGMVFTINALVSSKTGKNLPGVKEGFTKRVSSIPKECKDISDSSLVAAEEAAAKKELWFISVGGDKSQVGWMWSKGGKPNPGGVAKVEAVHEVLQFLLRFKSQSTVSSSKAFFIEISNNFVGT